MMPHKQNQYLYESLRKKHTCFHFLSTNIQIDKTEIKIKQHFSLDNGPDFYPEMRIPFNKHLTADKLPEFSILEQLAFQIGMVELISYWKTACPPKVMIHHQKLADQQIAFWKKLYYNGLGEFFHINSIKTDLGSFLKIECFGERLHPQNFILNNSSESTIIPIGGGKDSIVSLELLKASGRKCVPFVVNPSPATRASIRNAGIPEDDAIFFYRTLDKEMLHLNAEGYLNGHTPFSSLLAFSTLLASVWSGIQDVALSNEASANEATIPGTNINHQYSKSIEFENDFRNYVRDFIPVRTNYFSLLRPLNEIQIAGIFSRFHWHHSDFRSCNVGSKENRWCGSCPKCLFTWLMLAPFLDHDKLIGIFGKDLEEDENLRAPLLQLAGLDDEKPFECVGTISEVQAAISTINKMRNKKGKLLQGIKSPEIQNPEIFLQEFNKEHNLTDDYEKTIKKAIEGLNV